MTRRAALVTVVAAPAMALTAMGFTSANVRNAGITWGCDGAICTANVDGSGRRVLVPMNPDGAGDPSWTRDGRLSFRYDSPDYRGFMMASGLSMAMNSPW